MPERLTIGKVATKLAQTKKRNLYTCYSDYNKALNSVSHNWLEKVHLL